jgi:hypothetical protein
MMDGIVVHIIVLNSFYSSFSYGQDKQTANILYFYFYEDLYFVSLLPSCLLSRNAKVKIYKPIILPLVYGLSH